MRIFCSKCDKTFKGDGGLQWHLENIHGRAGRESTPDRMLVCSPAAQQFVDQVATKTGLPMREALDLMIAVAIDDDSLEPVLETWDPAVTGPENAPWCLPLSVVNYKGQRIVL